MRSKNILGVIVGLGLLAGATGAQAFTGVIQRITDADTFFVGSTEVRLNGIDTPDPDQICTRAGKKYKCGEEAKAALLQIVAGRPLTCTKVGQDVFKRVVARCEVDGKDVAAELVRQGWAVAFRKFSKQYIPLEAEARAAKRGLWEGAFDRPRDWRRKKKNWVN